MLDPPPRPLCPACGGDQLRSLGLGGPAAISSCRSCRGVFARVEAVARIGRTHGYGHPMLRVGLGPARCRGCKSVLAAGAACATCDCQVIACPACAQTMERVTVERLTIDVCRPCRSVWLDQGELGELVALSRQRQAFAPDGQATRNVGVSWIDVPAGVVDPGPLIGGVADGGLALGELTIEAVAHAPELAASAGEAAIAIVEATGQAAAEGVSSVGSIMLELLGGLFDGL